MDDPDEVSIIDAEQSPIQADFGVMLDSGSTIRTGTGRLELVLVPNGSVIAIDENTTFRIDGLNPVHADQSATGNAFSLVTGKLRMIAAPNTGSYYTIRMPSAVARVEPHPRYPSRRCRAGATVTNMCLLRVAEFQAARKGYR